MREEEYKILEHINKLSRAEGWGIYLAIGANNGEDEWRIERHDEMMLFEDDTRAIRHIIDMALNHNSKLHVYALEFMINHGSHQELKTILKSITI